MGKSWHNNHHAFPGSAPLGLLAGEWDPGWWVLMVLQKMRLVWSTTLPTRTELHAADVPGAAALRARPKGLAAVLSVDVTRRLISPRTLFTHDPTAMRVHIAIARDKILGLPAFCIAIARRSAAYVLLAIVLAPLAVAFENIRESFDVS